jgi:NADPH-dependent 2,4-dienoyl-CoA reductase/sulfur reductase-like enzyme
MSTFRPQAPLSPPCSVDPGRRDFLLKLAGASTFAAAPRAFAAAPRVVVIGAGFGGATAARYIREWSPDIEVVLIERNRELISCPQSNRVLSGVVGLDSLTRGYAQLSSRWGIRVFHKEATAIDAAKRQVRLSDGLVIGYDRLIVSPGVDLLYESFPGLRNPTNQQLVPHAWKAGPQTLLLRRQVESMPDGGVFALTVPKAPYRCPPGPYERACQVAWYFKTSKPRSKVLILDANDKVQSKEALFTKIWKERYPGIIEYRPNSTLVDVDAATLTAKLEFEDVKADVLNVIPPQRAGGIAVQAELITVNDKWVGVDFLTYESAAARNVHVLGDAIAAAPAMPKSAHMANQHAKVAAAAVIALLHGAAPDPSPIVNNTCYSFVTDKEVIHVASVHRYDPEKKTMVVAPGSSGVSTEASELEGVYGEAWGRNILVDALG